jgi:hypothetical protein
MGGKPQVSTRGTKEWRRSRIGLEYDTFAATRLATGQQMAAAIQLAYNSPEAKQLSALVERRDVQSTRRQSTAQPAGCSAGYRVLALETFFAPADVSSESPSNLRARTLLLTASCRYFTLRLRLGASCARTRNSRAHILWMTAEAIEEPRYLNSSTTGGRGSLRALSMDSAAELALLRRHHSTMTLTR